MRSKLLFRIEDNPGDFGLTQWALEKQISRLNPLSLEMERKGRMTSLDAFVLRIVIVVK